MEAMRMCAARSSKTKLPPNPVETNKQQTMTPMHNPTALFKSHASGYVLMTPCSLCYLLQLHLVSEESCHQFQQGYRRLSFFWDQERTAFTTVDIGYD